MQGEQGDSKVFHNQQGRFPFCWITFGSLWFSCLDKPGSTVVERLGLNSSVVLNCWAVEGHQRAEAIYWNVNLKRNNTCENTFFYRLGNILYLLALITVTSSVDRHRIIQRSSRNFSSSALPKVVHNTERMRTTERVPGNEKVSVSNTVSQPSLVSTTAWQAEWWSGRMKKRLNETEEREKHWEEKRKI